MTPTTLLQRQRPPRFRGQTTSIAIEVSPRAADGAEIARADEPITMGLPLPRGLCMDARSLTLRDACGRAQRVQWHVLDRWSDGSVRWALIDFQGSTGSDGAARYEILVGGDSIRSDGPSIATSRSGGAISIDTGVAQFTVSPGDLFPFASITADDRHLIDVKQSALVIEDASGISCSVVVKKVAIEESGRLRTVVRCEGSVSGSPSMRTLDVIARLHFFAGSAAVRFALTIRNPGRAEHAGGCWTLGDVGSALLRDVALRLAFWGEEGAATVRCSEDVRAAFRAHEPPFELYQESSGGERWRSPNHVNRSGVVPHQMAGYRLRSGTSPDRGSRATPVVSVSRGDRTLSVAVPQFWQNFPQAIEADGRGLTLRLLPRQYPDVHELQGGEQKTYTFFVAFDDDRVTDVPLDWCRAPLLARATPSWYCKSGAVSYLVPSDDDPNREYVALVQAAIEGADTFERKREVVDEYGWRHFGDTYADHEAVAAPGGAPLASHYNNQYDGVAGFAYQFLRSADARWWTLMDDLARHVVDIDTYHTDRDKAAYNHGLFWHTFHYVAAGTSTHRSYPKHPSIGGGPSAEHNYPTGLMLHYFLTGDPRSRETAIALAQWVINMDDGSRTVFGWLDRGATGLASASGSPLYHGPGRGAANSVIALMVGHRLTGDLRFLQKVEALIRRCIHPEDDLDARNLLDAERRWFYTAFLQALGKYLDCKEEMDALDGSYAYARASLLHYARWMAKHEYPYLDRPEILEYPTETWAAQDMRKSDVFKFAAKHSAGAERAEFLERSDFFFNSSVSTLTSKPTRTLARPVTLMMTNGFMHSGFSRDRDFAAPPPAIGLALGASEQFVPQKVRAIRKARIIAAAAAPLLAAAAGVLYWIL